MDNKKENNVGSVKLFGSYYIDNEKNKQPIEWIILEQYENKMLLISKYGIDCKKYNSTLGDVTWETCDLRKWLNNDFLNSAFSKEEQNIILNTNIHTDNNPEYQTNGGNDTVDKIFLLSIEEVEKYFSLLVKGCPPTNFAKIKGAETFYNDNCWWWLRSPGYICRIVWDDLRYSVFVDCDGEVIYHGALVYSNNICVRPALWINIE